MAKNNIAIDTHSFLKKITDPLCYKDLNLYVQLNHFFLFKFILVLLTCMMSSMLQYDVEKIFKRCIFNSE